QAERPSSALAPCRRARAAGGRASASHPSRADARGSPCAAPRPALIRQQSRAPKVPPVRLTTPVDPVLLPTSPSLSVDMSPMMTTLRCLAALTLLSALLAPASARAGYAYVSFSGPGGTDAYGGGINDTGQSTGFYFDSSGAAHGF